MPWASRPPPLIDASHEGSAQGQRQSQRCGLSDPCPSGHHPFVQALRERNFRYLFAARAISFFGTNLAPIAVAFAVLGLTDSATDVGLAFAAWTLAQVSTLLVGGVVGDRLPRQLVMIVSDSANCVVRTAMGLLLVTGNAEVWAADRAPGGRRVRDGVLLAGLERARAADRARGVAPAGERADEHRPLRGLPARRRGGRHDRRDDRRRVRAASRRQRPTRRARRSSPACASRVAAAHAPPRGTSPGSSPRAGGPSPSTRGSGCITALDLALLPHHLRAVLRAGPLRGEAVDGRRRRLGDRGHGRGDRRARGRARRAPRTSRTARWS